MFFRDGEQLIYYGESLHSDYERFNRIARGIDAYKQGEILNLSFCRNSNLMPVKINFSLWRVNDKNSHMYERCNFERKYTFNIPDGNRISYVTVPRMNTDPADLYPCEYSEEKASTFEDISDPRVIVIAKDYKGIVGEIAKDLMIDLEKPLRSKYQLKYDNKYFKLVNLYLPDSITEDAIRLLKPNVLG